MPSSLTPRHDAEIERFWRLAGDESLPPADRYGYAWAAMDWETDRQLIIESSRKPLCIDLFRIYYPQGS
jgi:hypothetical protein